MTSSPDWIAAETGLRSDGRIGGPVWVAHRDGRIAEVRWGEAPPDGPEPAPGTLTPGLIDLQCNGGLGIDLATTPPAEWGPWRHWLATNGVTSVAPTFITGPLHGLVDQIKAAHAYSSEQVASSTAGARLLGVHLEGPFISPERLGAHRRRWRLDPTPEHLDALTGLPPGALGMVTLAPELPGADEMIIGLRQAGVLVSIGHSDASAEQVDRAADLGATMVTHLGNAQRGLHQREPGVLGAALIDDRLMLGLIGDLTHLHPGLIELARRAAPNRCVLVTDAVADAGLGVEAPRARADIRPAAGGTAYPDDGTAYPDDGTAYPDGGTADGGTTDATGLADAAEPTVLAGGIHTGAMVVAGLIDAGFAPGWVLDAFTRAPAQAIGRDDLGTLTVGGWADLVRWNANWDVESTWIAGEPVEALA